MPRRDSSFAPRVTLTSHGHHLRFFHGDCLDVLRRLEDASTDVVVTSPPYNLGIRYRSYDDARPRADYLSWVATWIREVARVLTPEGSLFLNVGSKPTDPWAAIDVAQAVRPFLHLQNTIHWIKSIAIALDDVGAGTRDGAWASSGPAGNTHLAVGHYKPINSRRFVNDCHEFVFHFTPHGRTPLDRLAIGVPYQDASNVTRWRQAGAGRRCRGNTWFLPYDTIQSRDRERPHPATFPERLPEYCLRLHGLRRIARVLDPFVGLGSTAVACARLGLDFDGVEIDDQYLDVAVERTRAALAAECAESSPPPGAPAAPAARARARARQPLLPDME
jgi:site-specific DNA-methyltransferase (adenine-specific)